MDESLANEARLHGWRVQNLFEAMIVCLGSIRLIVTEDAGSYYYDQDTGAIKPPDFRIVKDDGKQVLIEVKNVNPRILDEVPVNERDLKEKQQYADLMATRLLRSLLVCSQPLVGGRSSSFGAAKRQANLALRDRDESRRIGAMGDSMIGTRPPLTLSLIADPKQPQKVQNISTSEEELGFTISRVELSCDGQVLSTAREQKIAWFLMSYGHRDVHQDIRFDDGGHLERINLQVTPPVPDEEGAKAVSSQGFEIIGHLSEMYSTYYNLMTLTATGKIKQLRHEPAPDVLADLIPSDYWSGTSRDLPIWRFIIRPSAGPASTNDT